MSSAVQPFFIFNILDTTFIYIEAELTSQEFAAAIHVTQRGSMTLSLAKQY